MRVCGHELRHGFGERRLERAARLAAEAGLEVWCCPFTNGLDRDELMVFVLDGAERAARLRLSGASAVYLGTAARTAIDWLPS
jgi:hypothetical protein